MKEEVSGGNEKNQEKEIMKDILTHSNISNHIRELNSEAGARDNDTDKTDKDPQPRKKKSRESKKKEKDRREKKRSHSPDPDSSPSILKEGQLPATRKSANKGETTTTKRTPYDHKNKRKVIEASIVSSKIDKYMEITM